MKSVPATPLPEVLGFMQLLWAVTHGMEAKSKRMARDLGVTGPQRLVLRVVGLHPGISAGHVAELLRVHPSTLTGIFQRLVAQRLLSRTADPTDRRRTILRLTPAGQRANSISTGTIEAAIGEALGGVTDRDRGGTRRVLTRLADCLNPVEHG